MTTFLSETRPLVVIESPYAGDVEANIAYARRAMAHSFSQGEFPYASHLLYTQEGILDDTKPEDRRLGMEAGYAWGRAAQSVVFYVDRGWSSGMREGARRAVARGQCIEVRALDRQKTPDDDEPIHQAQAHAERMGADGSDGAAAR